MSEHQSTDPLAAVLTEWLHLSNPEQRAAELRAFLARHGLEVRPVAPPCPRGCPNGECHTFGECEA